MKLKMTEGSYLNIITDQKDGDKPIQKFAYCNDDELTRLIIAAPEMLEALIELCKYKYRIMVNDKNDKTGISSFKNLWHKEVHIIEEVKGKSIEEILK